MPDIFLDTDVAFDILSKREPHYKSSVILLELAAKGSIRLIISESSLANLFYLCFDIYKIKDAALKLSDFVGSCEVAMPGKILFFYHFIQHLEIKKMPYNILLHCGRNQIILLRGIKEIINMALYPCRFIHQMSS